MSTFTLKEIEAAVGVLKANNAAPLDGWYYVHIHPDQHRRMKRDRSRWRKRLRKDGLAGKNVVRRLGRHWWDRWR